MTSITDVIHPALLINVLPMDVHVWSIQGHAKFPTEIDWKKRKDVVRHHMKSSNATYLRKSNGALG